MSFDVHTNLASSLVVTAPSPATSGTSLTVTAGQGAYFPTAPFNCTVCPAGVLPTPLNAEIVRVTAIVGDTFTITRAQESTTAMPIAVGYFIANSITAKDITDIEAGVNASAVAGPVTTSGLTMTTARLLGRTTAATGAVEEITVGTGLSLLAGSLSNTVTAPVGADPTASLGLTAVNGSASTFMRSDGAPALDQTIAPTWTGGHKFQNGLGSGNQPILVGADLGATTLTDATSKFGKINTPHYTNAEAGVSLITGFNTSGANTIYIGGGAAGQNAATFIDFYTAATTTTSTGTRRGGFNQNGVFSIATTTDSTTSTDGSITTAGGMGIAKKLFVGTSVSSPQLISTVATGTAPLTVTSTTNVANLNASSLSGATFAAPGAIGGGTPGSGAFTTITASSTITPSQTAGIVGTTTNNDANAGSVGEYVESVINNAGKVSLTTGVAANVTSISLTAGDWDVFGVTYFHQGATTLAADYYTGPSSTSATLGSTNAADIAREPGTNAAAIDVIRSLFWPQIRFSLASTTTIYLVAFSDFTVSTNAAYGAIRARRAR